MTRPRIIKQNESSEEKFFHAPLAMKRGSAHETLLSGRHHAERGKAER